MSEVPLTYNLGDFRFREERIELTAMGCSERLKNEVRERVLALSDCGWQFVSMESQGSWLYLKFCRKRVRRLCQELKRRPAFPDIVLN